MDNALTDLKHSPGPWRLADTDVVADAFGEEVLIAGVYAGGYTRGGNGNRERLEANARLIAAAPELLEALKAILADCGETTMDGYVENSIHSDEVNKARAAISKATGAA